MKKMNEVLNYYVDYANNDSFRYNVSESDTSYIHDNQIDAAKEIVKAFNNKILRRNHVILVAKMQSGKTGVCNAVVNIINKIKLNRVMGINKFLFVTGMNDCGLKCQTYERLIEQVMDANVCNTYVGKNCRKNKNNKYFVLKNSDMSNFEGDLENTLLIIDECHYGSNEKNILSQFLIKNGINWKNENEMIRKNTYILSVSATPFDEIISDTAQCKKIVELKTDEEYVGVSDYIKEGLVHCGKSNDVVGTISYGLRDALSKMRKDDVCGVCFVRSRHFDELEHDDFVKYNFDIYEMWSNGSKIEYDKLSHRINQLIADNEYNKQFKDITSPFLLMKKKNIKPLLVLIKGAYRAGITLNTEHKDYIYMVYDYSVKSAATAQALLGRMCGYRKIGTPLKTDFYINHTFANMYAKWEKDFTNRDNIPCDKLMESWLISPSECDGTEVLASKSSGNFTIDLSIEEIENLYNKCKSKKMGRANAKKLFADILDNHNIDIQYDYFHEAHMSGKNNYATSSQEKRFNSFSENLLVFGFRADKIKEFIKDTGRDYLTTEDFGKKCVSIVLDAEIDKNSGKVIGGNNRLLVYYSEVGAYKMKTNQASMYKKHKDTSNL